MNTNELTNLIISQGHVGSVLTQCQDVSDPPDKVAKTNEDEAAEDSDEDDDDDENMIFGLTTVVNLANPDKKECVKQLVSYFVEKCEEGAKDEEATQKLRNMLNDSSKQTGFLINERFINIPPQIAIPMLENLQKEIARAADKKMPFKFAQYLMVLKFYRTAEKTSKKGNGKKNQNKSHVEQTHYSNPEEEIFDKDLLLSYEFSVAEDADSGLTGNWLEGDEALTPYRRVIVFEAKQLSHLITKIKDFVD